MLILEPDILTACTQSAVKNVFIRGSVVRYVHLPSSAVDTALLEDATRRGEGTDIISNTDTIIESAQQASKTR